MADWGTVGLLSGIGNFAHNFEDGLITYNTVQNQKTRMKMEQAMTGLQQNEDGSFGYTPQKQQQIQLQEAANQRQMKELDPNSPESRIKRDTMKGLLEATRPGLGSMVPENASGADVDTISGMTKPLVSGQFNVLGQQARGQSMQGLIDVKRQQLETSKDNQSAQSVNKIIDDSQLKNHQQRIQGANRILDQLNDAKSGKIVDTNQLLGDVNTEYVNLLTGANNSALGKQERTEYRTMAGDLSGLLQRIKAEPESINSPEIMNQLETQVRGLKSNYQSNYQQRAQLLKKNYSHNQQANQAQDDKIKEMIDSVKDSDQSAGGAGLLDQQAKDMARLKELRAKAAGGG